MSKALVAKNLSTNQMRVDIDNIIKEESKLYLCQAACEWVRALSMIVSWWFR